VGKAERKKGRVRERIEMAKVKMKTRKSVASRFKITGSGKIMARHPGKRHLLTKKSSSKKRALSKDSALHSSRCLVVKKLLGLKRGA